MATGGASYKPYTKNTLAEVIAEKEAKTKRWENASSKQKKCWMKFRTSGIAGFADGAAASLINRLEALAAELPIGHPSKEDIERAISEIGLLRKFGIPTWRNVVFDQINKSEV